MNLDKVPKIEYIVWKVKSKIAYEIGRLQPDNMFKVMIERIRNRKSIKSNYEEEMKLLPYVNLSLRALTLRELEK
jgi:hypothetical protein